MLDDKRNINYRERQSFFDSFLRYGFFSFYSKVVELNKDEQYWKEENKRRFKGDLRNRVFDSSLKGLFFSEDYYIEGENRGIFNQVFKDFERNL